MQIGKKHDASAALLIGGKNVKEEQSRVNRMNIIVATPGRLLQHMDETPGFDASQLQLLVLDEADRILDMGFAQTLDAILGNLPKERQTMLFSATQVEGWGVELGRLSVKVEMGKSSGGEAGAWGGGGGGVMLYLYKGGEL